MKKLPLIGIPCRRWVNTAEPWWPPHDGILVTAIDAIIQGGGVPMLIPITSSRTVMRQLYERTDGIMFAGGGDVEPRFYGAQPEAELVNTNASIDQMELTLSSWTVLDQKPLLGICRGIQIINVALGGTLIQDIGLSYKTTINHEASADRHNPAELIHDLLLEEDSRLARLLGVTSLMVNTMHHQALDRVAADLRVAGRAPDGVIEAVEGRNDHYVLGVQSHPEAVAAIDERWQNVFTDFCGAAAVFAGSRAATNVAI
jgi:putative glutamine amidotransferase